MKKPVALLSVVVVIQLTTIVLLINGVKCQQQQEETLLVSSSTTEKAIEDLRDNNNNTNVSNNNNDNLEERTFSLNNNENSDNNSSKSSTQCSHKGRQYFNGQIVPIEDQPCLNCTCRRAILQCYLRVCPPQISAEGHRKMQLNGGHLTQKCRIHKEPNQCCPTMKCEPDNDSYLQATNSSTSFSNNMNNDNNNLLPKLKAGSQPRDSILLITSNPEQSNSLVVIDKQQQRQQSSLENQSNEYSNALLDALLETVYTSASQQALSGVNVQGSCMVNGSLYVEGSAIIPEANAYCQYCYCIRQKIMCIKPKCHLSISGCTAKYSNEYACCPTSYSCSASPSNYSMSHGGSMSSARLNHHQNNHLVDFSSNSNSVASKLSAAIEQLTRLSSQLPASTNDMTIGSPLARQVDRSLNQPADTNNSNDSISSTMLALINSLALPTLTTTTASTGNETSSSVGTRPANVSMANSELAGLNNSSTTTTTTMTTSPPTSTSSSSSSTTTQATTSTSNKDDESKKEEEESSSKRSKEDEVEVNSNESEENDNEDKDKDKKDSSSSAKKNKKTTPTQATQPSNVTSGDNKPVMSREDFLEPMKKLGPLVVSPTSPSGCVENNRLYAIGEQIPTLESCKHCYCGIDGLKDCRIIECGLKMAHVHGCKPITLPNHCCPMRYECPPQAVATNSKQIDSTSRYRSDNSSERHQADDTTNEQNGAGLFSGISQCRYGIDCSANNMTTTNELSGSNSYSQWPGTGSIDGTIGGGLLENPNMKGGLSFDADIPTFNTTRVVDNSGLSSPIVNHLNKQNNATGFANLTEELNKFIMQINNSNQQNTNAGHTPDYALISPNGRAPSALPMFNSNISNFNDSTRTDYHTVLPPSTSTTTEPPLPPSGMMGIPSIQPTPLEDPNLEYKVEPTPASIMKLIESITTFRESQSAAAQNISGHLQRDSRSSDQNTNNVLVDNHRPLAELTNSAEGYDFTLADRFNYNNNSDIPHNRSLRHYNYFPHRSLPANIAVHYDEDNNSSSGNPFPLIPVVTMKPETLKNLLLSSPAPSEGDTNSMDDASTPTPPGQPTTGIPIGLDAERTTETNGWLRSLTGMVQSFGKRLVGINSNPNNHYNLGFNEALQGAAATSGSMTNQTEKPASSFREQSDSLSSGLSARSTRGDQSLLDQLLMSMINTSSSGADRTPTNEEAQAQPTQQLVMRPFRGILQVEGERPIVNKNKPFRHTDTDNQKKPFLSVPYVSPSNEASTVEIVTAPVPAEPEVFALDSSPPAVNNKPATPTNPNQINHQQQQQFARRSDIEDSDELLSEIPTASPAIKNNKEQVSFNINKQQQVVMHPPGRQQPNLNVHQQQQQIANQKFQMSTCFDALTNKTYQQNEIIPKDGDPCKTCTCVLGKELCQNLICPEKPAEDCREERRPGECCANYLCGNNVTQLTTSTTSAHLLNHLPDVGTNARLLATNNNNNNNNNNNVMMPMLVNARQQQPANNVIPLIASMQGRARSVQGYNNNNNNNNGSPMTIQANNNNNRRQIQLPDYPIRTSELANILPPHLRFRPIANTQNSPKNGGGPNNFFTSNILAPNNGMTFTNYLSNMDASKVLFSGQANQRFITHQTPTTNPFNNNVNVNVLQQTTTNNLNNQMRRNDLMMINNNKVLPLGSINSNANNNNGIVSDNTSVQPRPPMILQHTRSGISFNNNQLLPNSIVNTRTRTDSSTQKNQPTDSSGLGWKQSTPSDQSRLHFQQNHHQRQQHQSSFYADGTSSSLNLNNFPTVNNPSSAPSFDNPQAIIPPNVLISRMSGNGVIDINNNNSGQFNQASKNSEIPIGSTQQFVPPPLNNQADNNISIPFKKPATIVIDDKQISPTDHKQQPSKELSTISNEVKDNIVEMKERVLFESRPAFGLNINSVDTGFKPINPPTVMMTTNNNQEKIVPKQTIDSVEDSPLTLTPTSNSSFESSPTSSQTFPSSSISTTDKLKEPSTVVNQSNFMNEMTTQISISVKNDYSSLAADNLHQISSTKSSLSPDNMSAATTTQSPALDNSWKDDDKSETTNPLTRDDMNSTADNSSHSFEPPSIESNNTVNPDTPESVKISTTTTQNTNQAPSTQTQSNPSETSTSVSSLSSSSSQSPQADNINSSSNDNQFDDLSAMFRVSECNIYGRIYQVGQTIEELSDVCKRCTCTSMGVDCQSRC